MHIKKEDHKILEVLDSPDSTLRINVMLEQKEVSTKLAWDVSFPDDWIRHFDETILERLAIMTIDGGLTDDEAFKALKVVFK
jgi:hypothetical protein